MPTYLCHGFRWHRRDIRIFVIIHDIEDAAPDWVVGRLTSSAIISQLRTNFDFLPKSALTTSSQLRSTHDPSKTAPLHFDDDFSLPPSKTPASEDSVLMHETSPVKLLEEYDLAESKHPSRPYAYVADYVTRVDLSASIADEMTKYESTAEKRGGQWFEALRDQLQKGEDIRWYIVVCGDEERAVPEISDGEDDDDGPPTPVQEQRHAFRDHSHQGVSSSEASTQSDSDSVSRSDSQRSPPPRSLRHKSSQAFRRIFGKREA